MPAGRQRLPNIVFLFSPPPIIRCLFTRRGFPFAHGFADFFKVRLRNCPSGRAARTSYTWQLVPSSKLPVCHCPFPLVTRAAEQLFVGYTVRTTIGNGVFVVDFQVRQPALSAVVTAFLLLSTKSFFFSFTRSRPSTARTKPIENHSESPILTSYRPVSWGILPLF